jgi:hypothetical protein
MLQAVSISSRVKRKHGCNNGGVLTKCALRKEMMEMIARSFYRY